MNETNGYEELSLSSMRFDLGNEIKRHWKKAPLIILLIICGFVSFISIKNIKDTRLGKLLLKSYIDVTGFRILHILLHLAIGFFLPDFIWLSLLISFAWELFEAIMSKYADKWWGTPYDNFQDIIVNYVGFGLGYGLNKSIYG